MKLFSTMLPYLLLVSFYSGHINNFDLDKIKAINESPYRAVAVRSADVYETKTYSEKEFATALSLFKKESKKDIWPWLFLNRIVGYHEGEKSFTPAAKTEYFKKIKGMDIYNEAGALQDFYDIWKTSLRIAKALGSPGILVDPEGYNNYKIYDLSYLSKQIGKQENEIRKRLMIIGAELVDIANKEYPEAILWFTFTGLESSKTESIACIVEGMLERIRDKNMKLKIVSGGMLSLGYCYESLDDLKAMIDERHNKLKDKISKYDPSLRLGGTIAPWHDVRLKKEGYFTRGKCGKNNLNNMDDFEPLLKHLFNSYQYVWIYAASMLGYNPYDSDLSPLYNKTLQNALSGIK